MVDQYVITCHRGWKQIAITFTEININDLYMNLWSLKVGRYSSQGTWCYVMRACHRGYKVKTRAILSYLSLPVSGSDYEFFCVPGLIELLRGASVWNVSVKWLWVCVPAHGHWLAISVVGHRASIYEWFAPSHPCRTHRGIQCQHDNLTAVSC